MDKSFTYAVVTYDYGKISVPYMMVSLSKIGINPDKGYDGG